MHPAQLRERPRRRPYVLDEQPTKLPRADPETRREVFGRHLIQRPALDQPQRPHHRARAAAPGGEVRGHFRPTAKARSKSRFLGQRRRRIETDVALSGRRGRADRTAIDAGRANADENTSVKPPVAGQKYPIAGIVIEIHGGRLARRVRAAGGFRTWSSISEGTQSFGWVPQTGRPAGRRDDLMDQPTWLSLYDNNLYPTVVIPSGPERSRFGRKRMITRGYHAL